MNSHLSRDVVSLRIPAFFVAALTTLVLFGWPSSASATQVEDAVCVASNNCFAVGVDDPEGVSKSQVRRWDGAKWSSETVPAPSGATASELSGIACLSASNCKAVGSYKDATLVTRSLALHWNGTSWSVVATPAIPTGATATELEGVSCESNGFCMAVGSKLTTSSGRRAYALTWNGSAWNYATTITEPSGSSASSLADVACFSPLECRVAGEYTISGVDKPRVLFHQLFKPWVEDSVPLPSGVSQGELTDIACSTATACWAVGSSVTSGGVRQPMVLSRSTSWTVAAAPGMPFSQKAELLGLSCTSSTSCTAVGKAEDEEGDLGPVTLSWSGSTWTDSRPDLPNLAKTGSLNAVSCLSGTGCAATGFVSYSHLARERNLAYSGSDAQWSVTDDGGAPTSEWGSIGASSVGSQISDSWCHNQESSTRCIEVGAITNENGRRSSMVRNTKASGSPTMSEVPEPAHSKLSELRGVMCPSTTSCMAVGSYVAEDVEMTLAVQWNGTEWSLLESPNPTGAVGSSLEEVHCVSSSACMAVGSFMTSTGVEKAFALRWNGASWAVESTYGQENALGTGYEGLWCSAITACFAIGSFTDSGGTTKPLAVQLGSGTVTAQSAQQPTGSNVAELLGLSCTSSTHCVAVGRYVDSNGVRKTLAMKYVSGGSPVWQVQTTPNPSGGTLNELAGISCTSTSNCLAVGSGLRNGSVEPLAASWNGTAWSEVPTQSTNNPQFGGQAGVVTTQFRDVSCSTKTQECHAVGAIQAHDYPTRLLAADWSYGGAEKKWSKAPEIGDLESELVDVSCPELGECIAIGRAWPDPTGVPLTTVPGRAWVLDDDHWVPLPSLGSLQVAGIDCLAPDECMVVGGTGSAPEARWWDGEEWTTQEMPKNVQIPRDVACPSADNCVAIGFEIDKGLKAHPRAAVWNGTTWAEVTVPVKGTNNQLTGVACVADDDCTAVGRYQEGSSYYARLLHWNGTAWSAPTLPSISGTDQDLQSVHCDSTPFCVATGEHTVEGKERVLGLTWNGTAWSLATGPALKSGSTFDLEGVACTSSTECMATGATTPILEPLAFAWNGSNWSVEDASTPFGAQGARLYGVDCAAEEELGSACVSVGTFIFRGSVAEDKKFREPLTFIRQTDEAEEEEKPAREWKPDEVWTPTSGFADAWCTSTSNCVAVGSYNNADGEQEAQIKTGTGSSWSEMIAPAPSGSLASTLTSVTCTSSSACMAVGAYEAEDKVWKTLAMRWNGTAWSVTATSNPSGALYSRLSGVACGSESSCQAVGSYINEKGTELSIAYKWNGVSWSQVTVPMPSGAEASRLRSVGCVSSSSCTAVGSQHGSAGGHKTFVINWNGTAWAHVATPNVAEATAQDLADIACSSSSSCMAVGAYQTQEETIKTMTMRWNGSSWWIVAAPNPGGMFDSLTAVACPSSSICLAIGTYEGSRGVLPMAVSWDGSSWTQGNVEELTEDSDADIFDTSLGGVSCSSTTDCVAVGAYATQNGIGGSPESEEHGLHELTIRFNGTAWARPSEDAPTGSINGVSCPDEATCIGVGSGDAPDDGIGTVNQAWLMQGAEWKPLSMPSPESSKVLMDISCSAADACTAVGANTSTGKFLVERWNGTSWSAQTPPVPSTGSGHTLASVSCPSASSCTGVGYSDTGEENTAMRALRWSGSSWSESSITAPSGATSTALLDTDCATESSCIAVGTYTDEKGVDHPLIRHWNGSSWISGTVSAPAESIETILRAVSCSSTSACTAVGSYKTTPGADGRRNFVVRWNGTAWSVQTTPEFEDVARTELHDVGCLSGTECVALGEMVVLEGESLAATAVYSSMLVWDGTEWKLEAANAPNGAPGPSITSLACNATDCVAAGSTHEADIPLALITKTDSVNDATLGASSYLAPVQAAAIKVAGKPCIEGIREKFHIKESILIVKDPKILEGEASADFCWRRKKVRWKHFYGADAWKNSGIASLGWWVDQEEWRHRSCTQTRRKCVGKFQAVFKCCNVAVQVLPDVRYHARCIEFELFSPKIRQPGYKTNVKHERCVPRNLIAQGAALPEADPVDGDRFGVFRPSIARFFLTTQFGPVVPVATSISHYGWGSDVPLVGDWNDDSRASLAVYRPSEARFWMTNSIGESPVASTSVVYGNHGDIPVVGDWNCDGADTPGVFRNGIWYMSDSLTSGATHHSVGYGTSGDIPVVGDWDGDGCDTVGLVRKVGSAANWYLSNSMTGSGATHYAVSFGLWGDRPYTGDWDDDGDDTIGMFRPSTITWSMRDALTPGGPHHTFRYGNSQDIPLVGDWDG